MVRIVTILVVASIVAVALISTTAPNLLRDVIAFVNEIDVPGSTGAEESEPADNPSEANKAAAKAAPPKSASRRTTSPAGGTVPEQVVRQDAAAPGSESIPSTPYTEPTAPVYRIGPEQVSLYTTNSARGAVVGVLQKGQVVDPQFRLDGAGQRWIFVNIDDGRVSGFVRADSIEQRDRRP